MVAGAIVLTSLFGCKQQRNVLDDSGKSEFIINKRTRKIHSLDCPAVSRMSEKNKELRQDSIVDLLKDEYVICRKCKAGLYHADDGMIFKRLLYSNLYCGDVEISASYGDYIDAIDTMGEWYVNHVPTYASVVQEEAYSKYNGDCTHYEEYGLKNKGKTKKYLVMTENSDARSVDSLTAETSILRGSENAAIYYRDCYKNIDFQRRIAYYPCDILSDESDYHTPGDDCVRYVFAVLNYMDGDFTGKYKKLSNRSYSKTDSRTMTNDYRSVAYSFINLGFKIYDTKEQFVFVDDDQIPEGYIQRIEGGFSLQKGDILARNGHVHIYLGDGNTIEASNFGWGRVYRNYPQTYNIQVDQQNGGYVVSLENSVHEKEYYTRVYRYVGK